MKIFLEFIALVISIGTPIYWTIDGFKKNILAIFTMIIYGAYVVLPLIYIHELSLHHGLNIQVDAYIEQGLMLDIVFMTLLVLTYELYRKKAALTYVTNIETPQIHNLVLSMYGIIFCLIFLNNSLAGVDLFRSWMGNPNQITYGVKGLSFYLQNLVDSLVMLVLIGYATKIRRVYLLMMFLGAIFFIIPFGFRYRLIYLILGFFILFTYKNQLSIKKSLILGILIFSLLFSFLFLGANRSAIVGRSPTDKITFQLISLEKLIIQSRGGYVDLALYKGLDNGDITHDNGKSFFYYLLIRPIPSSFFEYGKKPYPPPLMLDSDKVLNLTSPKDCPGCRTGEAQTIMGSVYYSFGAWGTILVAIACGITLGFHSRRQSRKRACSSQNNV